MVPAGSMIPGCCHHNGQLGRLGKGCKVMSHTSRLVSRLGSWTLVGIRSEFGCGAQDPEYYVPQPRLLGSNLQ